MNDTAPLMVTENVARRLRAVARLRFVGHGAISVQQLGGVISIALRNDIVRAIEGGNSWRYCYVVGYTDDGFAFRCKEIDANNQPTGDAFDVIADSYPSFRQETLETCSPFITAGKIMRVWNGENIAYPTFQQTQQCP